MYKAHKFLGSSSTKTTCFLALSLLCLLLWMVPAARSLAAPADGVRCPGGFETQYDANTKTLRCQRSQNTFRPAVCDPKFDDHVVYRALRGLDQCIRVADVSSAGRSSTETRGRPVTCTVDTGERATWQIDIDPNVQERDRCKSLLVEWIYPSQQ
jgi:hypothetical protein